MSQKINSAPATVYLLADNLDTALAAGEDLLKSQLSWQAAETADTEEENAKAREQDREALAAARSLEMVLVARVLKSRESATELAKIDPLVRPISRIYTAGTALLSDAVSEMADGSKDEFEAGDCMAAYLRSRGLIAADEPAPSEPKLFAITEDFRIFGRVALGPIMDLVATFLDTLETHYELYDQNADRDALPSSLRTRPSEVTAS